MAEPAVAQLCGIPTPIGPDQTVIGELDFGDCVELDNSFVDLYIVTLPSSGRLTITMTSNELDAYLWLLDEDQIEVIIEDDDGGGGFNSRISNQLLAAGSYVILANTWVNDDTGLSETGQYTLSTSFVPDLEPDCSIHTIIDFDATITGSLDPGDCTEETLFVDGGPYLVDLYEITLPETGRLEVSMIGTGFDALVELTSFDLAFTLALDFDIGPDDTDAYIAVDGLPAGTYLILASSFDIDNGDYTLTTSFTDTDLDNDGIPDDEDPDDDGDGLPDEFEAGHGLDARDATDAGADADGDGLTNLQEYQLDTDLNNPDTDGDGSPDGAEVTAGRNPNLNELPILLQILIN